MLLLRHVSGNNEAGGAQIFVKSLQIEAVYLINPSFRIFFEKRDFYEPKNSYG